MNSNSNLDPYLSIAIKAALAAGRVILEVYSSDFSVEHKSDDSPLTLADKNAHRVIVNHLQTSEFPILSEEGRSVPYAERKSWQTLWIVDPLDGTKEFVKRNGEFTVNIALVQEDRPVLGVILIPVKAMLYFATPNRGAHKLAVDPGDTPVTDTGQGPAIAKILSKSHRLPADSDPERPYTIIGSRSHSTPELAQFVADQRRQHDRVEFISAGSSLKFCLLAEGRADVYPRLAPTMEWDTAAGQAIAENAGARVLVYDTGEPLRYNRENLLNPWFIVSRRGRK